MIDHIGTPEHLEKKDLWVNVGEPPVTGLKRIGHHERKDRCEDVKLNDPERGLFGVADGVSMANGWFAAPETMKKMQELLGAQLDEKIERVVWNDHLSQARKNELVDALIRSEMQTAILKADEQLNTRAKLDSSLTKAATTLTIAKLKRMPDGDQYVYHTNIGDSHLYLVREQKIIHLSKTDSWLMRAVREGELSYDLAIQIDQADSIDDVPESGKAFFPKRNAITSVVGMLNNQAIEIERCQVREGDRLVLCTDGITNQLKTDEILGYVLGNKEDKAAERFLQSAADDLSRAGTHPRAKADDESAVVYTIQTTAD